MAVGLGLVQDRFRVGVRQVDGVLVLRVVVFVRAPNSGNYQMSYSQHRMTLGP